MNINVCVIHIFQKYFTSLSINNAASHRTDGNKSSKIVKVYI